MPKSRRHRKLPKSKRRQQITPTPATTVQQTTAQQATVQPARTVVPPRAAAADVSAISARYPYINRELKAICIVTGIILVILVVLKFVLT